MREVVEGGVRDAADGAVGASKRANPSLDSFLDSFTQCVAQDTFGPTAFPLLSFRVRGQLFVEIFSHHSGKHTSRWRAVQNRRVLLSKKRRAIRMQMGRRTITVEEVWAQAEEAHADLAPPQPLAGDQAGEEQLLDHDAGDDAVDDHRNARREQETERATRRDEAEGEVFLVLVGDQRGVEKPADGDDGDAGAAGEGGEVAAMFAEVITCSSHSAFISMNVKRMPPSDEEGDGQFVLNFSNCSLKQEGDEAFDDFMAAQEEWNAYADEHGFDYNASEEVRDALRREVDAAMPKPKCRKLF